MPLLGRVYHQGRSDVWAMTPREADAYLADWAEQQRHA